jgi:hypothetical protein
VWPVQSAGGAVHTLAALPSNQILHIHLTV